MPRWRVLRWCRGRRCIRRSRCRGWRRCWRGIGGWLRLRWPCAQDGTVFTVDTVGAPLARVECDRATVPGSICKVGGAEDDAGRAGRVPGDDGAVVAAAGKVPVLGLVV